jgi:hypothetical protein
MTGIIIVKWVGATLVAYAMGTILLIQDMDILSDWLLMDPLHRLFNFYTLFVTHKQKMLETK